MSKGVTMRALVFLAGLIAGSFGFLFLILFFARALSGGTSSVAMFNGALALVSVSAALIGYWRFSDPADRRRRA